MDNGPYFLKLIAREYFSDNEDDCFDMLHRASDEIIISRERIRELEQRLSAARDEQGNDRA